jgi:hypothetical protein
MWCPDIPDADDGFVAVAGVFVAPWEQGGREYCSFSKKD